MKMPKRTILVVGMGTSPAVLTETVWELAHLAEPVLPDEVSVITTKSGRDMALSTLLAGEKGVWRRLLAALRDEDAVKGAIFSEKSFAHCLTGKHRATLAYLIQ